jgi:hypothetical protein
VALISMLSENVGIAGSFCSSVSSSTVTLCTSLHLCKYQLVNLAPAGR